jgi:hypothetical protein
VRRIAAVAALIVLVHAGAARADDCEFEGVTASLRSPVAVFGDTATVLANVFADGDANGLGNPDDLNGAEYALPMRGHATRFDFSHPLSLTLAARPDGRPDPIMWEQGRGIVAGGRVLVPGLPFPGYAGVAAAEARDGTITLLYGAGGNALLQRFAPDGTPGAPTVVAPAPLPRTPDDAYDFAPRLAVDKEGTVFGVAPGVAIRWPASGDPQLIRSSALHGPGTLVADQYGSAYFARSASPALVHLLTFGVTVTRLHGEPTNVVVDEAGVPVLAYTDHGRAYVRRNAANRSLGRGEAQSVAWYHGHAWTLVSRGDALYLIGSHVRLRVRAKPRYGESGASLAISAHGRAWAVWDEESDKLDQECDEFPVSEQTLWASFGLHDRSVIVRDLPGAATLY